MCAAAAPARRSGFSAANSVAANLPKLSARLRDAEVLGLRAKVASLADVTQGKRWAYSGPRRRLSKRKKDELDLIRLAEAHPELKPAYPNELREQIEKG